MIKTVKRYLAKSTWPLRRSFSRSKQREKALADMALLVPARVNDPAIVAAKSLLITWITPGTELLPAFLEHYRSMGVDHMLLVDGSGSPETHAFLLLQEDCSVWKPSPSCRTSNHGTRVHNALIQTYGLKKWVLSVDAGEFFVYPYMETRSLADLTSQLDDLERTTLWALRIDLYGPGPMKASAADATGPRYFDATGYYQSYGNLGQIQIRGGAVTRILNEQEFAGMPSLHRLPLIKPLPHVFYQGDRKLVIDEKLNWPHKWHPCPTGVLFSRDFNSGFCQRLLDGSDMDHPSSIGSFASSLRARLLSDPDFTLMAKNSVPYVSSTTLIDHGLMSDGGALRPASRFGIPEI
jgi:hypothetical protein